MRKTENLINFLDFEPYFNVTIPKFIHIKTTCRKSYFNAQSHNILIVLLAQRTYIAR